MVHITANNAIMRRVLVVEDNTAYRSAFCDSLKEGYPGFEITEVLDGEAALREADRCAYDLAFIDINLPGDNGLEVTRRLKARHPDTTVVVLTCHDLPEYRQAALRNGASVFLAKSSCTSDRLFATIAHLFPAERPAQRLHVG